MDLNRLTQLSERVQKEGITKAKEDLISRDELAFADLAEDIRTWDVQAQHRTGTGGDRITSEKLAGRLINVNASAKIIAFPFRRRVPNDCYLEVGRQRIDGIPLFDGTETEGILEGALGQLGKSGSIGVGNALATGGPANHQLSANRNISTHKAIVAIATSATPGIAMLNADAFTQPFGLPVLVVDGSQAQDLLAHALNGETASLHVQFTLEETQASNVEVRIAGRNSQLAPLVVMTPKSSWWTSTAERCGGIAAWLACIRELAEVQPERDVIFTANTGHELGHVGLDYFLTQNEGLARDARAWVHLGANFAARDCQIRMQYSDTRLRELFIGSLSAHDVTVASEVDGNTRPGGEARNIYDAGGSYISLLGSNGLFHHPDDRMANNVDLMVALQTSNAVVQLVRTLSGPN